MNRKNVRAVANALLNGLLAQGKYPVGYNQRVYAAPVKEGIIEDMTGHACGTVACIAGYAYLLTHPKARLLVEDETEVDKINRIQCAAAKFLGLDLETDSRADDLFDGAPLGWSPYTSPVTAQEAALVLFNLAETGKVDWKIARHR